MPADGGFGPPRALLRKTAHEALHETTLRGAHVAENLTRILPVDAARLCSVAQAGQTHYPLGGPHCLAKPTRGCRDGKKGPCLESHRRGTA
jgi:hypothetical protein